VIEFCLQNSVEISAVFKQQHFLIGLILSELTAVFEVPNSALHVKAINIIRNLLSWHDSDPRYALKEARQRLAHLYLPLVGIIMDSLPQLYEFVPDAQKRNSSTLPNAIQQSVAMAIAGTTGTTDMRKETGEMVQSRRPLLNAEATRHQVCG
jgi:dedicator of cytokinesis protein 6/7/8